MANTEQGNAPFSSAFFRKRRGSYDVKSVLYGHIGIAGTDEAEREAFVDFFFEMPPGSKDPCGMAGVIGL